MTEKSAALPPVVDTAVWAHELAALRVREKAATRELDAIAAALTAPSASPGSSTATRS